MILGVDPGLRHVGLCFLTEQGPTFWEIKPKHTDVLSCFRQIAEELGSWRAANQPAIVCMERQLSVGGQSSALMYATQMTVAAALKLDDPGLKVALPLPIQLRSYIKHVHNGPIATARETVEHFRQTQGWKSRISQHCVDAFYLCKLAEDVKAGKWSYKLPSNEQPFLPGVILNGQQHRPHQ